VISVANAFAEFKQRDRTNIELLTPLPLPAWAQLFDAVC
jgi:hypothetical protein